MGAFSTAASGIQNFQSKLDLVANNIANMNTVGYKKSSMLFGEMLSRTIQGASRPTGDLGGTNPTQIGLGNFIAGVRNDMGQASLKRTDKPTDMAINGRGFFITREGDQNFYTRAGGFNLDSNGNLVTPAGRKVQGFTETTDDGMNISPNSELGDVVINFGQKLEARATSQAQFSSNLDASSNQFGSAELVTAGSTGIQTVTQAAEPVATFVAPNPAQPGNTGEITISGDTSPTQYDTTGDATSIEAAQTIAEAINSDPDINQTVQATVREVNNNGVLVIQAIPTGAAFTIDGTNATGSGFGGTPLTTVEPADRPGPDQVGQHELTVTEAKAATVTTSTPVGFGGNAPNPNSDFTINGVRYQLSGGPSGINFSDTGTSSGNAAIIANIINNTPNTEVEATANPNGTITITQLDAGENNEISIDLGVPPNNNGVQPPGSIGLASIPDDDPTTPDTRVIDNGVNARAEVVFTPEEGGRERVRFFEDDAATGTASSLETVRQAVTGNSPAFPLIPGMTITAEELQPGRAVINAADAAEHTTNRQVFDSLGNSHDLTVNFTHVDENTWDWEATLPDEPELTLNNNTGTIEFTEDGLLQSNNPDQPISFTPPDANTVEIDFIFDGGEDSRIDGITQFTGQSTTSITSQDGFPSGVLEDFEVSQSGVINGFFDNGEVRPLAQLALADFNNPEGLSRTGDTSFRETVNSGVPIVLRPNTGGTGSIFGGAVEQSNVNLSDQFTELITSQRGVQSNSRVFTTQDQVIQEIVNLVQ